MKLTQALRQFALPAIFALTPPLAAHADTFDWSLTAPAPSLGGFTETGSGTLIANLASGQWIISSITGTVGGNSILGLTPGSNNLLFPESSLLDGSGLHFEIANGNNINVFSFYAPGSVISPGNNFGEFVNGSFTGVGVFSLTENAPVPEPSTLLLLGTGLLSLAGSEGYPRRA